MIRTFVVLMLVILSLGIFSYVLKPPQTLTISFLDVGQGDAIYIQAPNGNDVLIDGGRTAQVLRMLAAETSFFDRDIDVVVATHPDEDHIGGLVDVFDRYAVSYYLHSGITTESEAFSALTERIGEATEVIARTGMRVMLSDEVVLSVLYPDSIRSVSENDLSVILKLSYGDFDVLLTGDAGMQIEQLLVASYGSTLQSEILKVGHHGSKTSTLPSFVETVGPSAAIISAGKNNRYGHPHQRVLDVLEKIPVLETSVAGTISFESDGETFWLK